MSVARLSFALTFDLHVWHKPAFTLILQSAEEREKSEREACKKRSETPTIPDIIMTDMSDRSQAA